NQGSFLSIRVVKALARVFNITPEEVARGILSTNVLKWTVPDYLHVIQIYRRHTNCTCRVPLWPEVTGSLPVVLVWPPGEVRALSTKTSISAIFMGPASI
ncbi:hypothetical protein Goshw_009383, partial [Gossypium schwendimanii]|nr:hypothetical protein [Gossypium schwendimanii]